MSNLPATLQERVRARINEAIGEIIGEEEINRMVDAQFNHFVREELPKMIKTEIETEFKKAVRKALDGPEYAQVYDGYGSNGASELVKKIMTEHSDVIFTSAFNSMIQVAIYSLRNNMPRF